MLNQIQVFENRKFGQLEILMIDEKPYFPATECAKILGYAKPENAVERHCKGSLKRGVLTKGGKQTKNFIPEGDLYRLIIRSKLPEAEKFERWVFDKVLPTIRKHGGYITDNVLDRFKNNPDEAVDFFNALKKEQERCTILEKVVDKIVPKALYCDSILQSTNAIPVSVIAKDYGMTAAGFNRMLNDVRIQYKVGGVWVLRQNYCNKGYTVTRTYQISDEKSAIHTYWTQRGRKFIYDLLKSYDILPVVERTQIY